MPKITVRRQYTKTSKAPTIDEKQVELSKKSIEKNLKEKSDNPQAKVAAPFREYIPYPLFL